MRGLNGETLDTSWDDGRRGQCDRDQQDGEEQDSRFEKRKKVSADLKVKQAFEADLAKCKEITSKLFGA